MDRVPQNLAAVENHFHSEALNEVEAAGHSGQRLAAMRGAEAAWHN
jgi:hypothetical protein